MTAFLLFYYKPYSLFGSRFLSARAFSFVTLPSCRAAFLIGTGVPARACNLFFISFLTNDTAEPYISLTDENRTHEFADIVWPKHKRIENSPSFHMKQSHCEKPPNEPHHTIRLIDDLYLFHKKQYTPEVRERLFGLLGYDMKYTACRSSDLDPVIAWSNMRRDSIRIRICILDSVHPVRNTD